MPRTRRYQRRRRYHRRRWKRPYRTYARRYWRPYSKRTHRRSYGPHSWVRQAKPSNITTVYCTGWEPLGLVGTVAFRDALGKFVVSHGIKNNHEVTGLGSWLKDSPESFDAKKWAGGFGNAQISFSGLIDRAKKGACLFSADVTRFQFLKYAGVSCLFVPVQDVSWIFYADTVIGGNQDDYDKAKKWQHPAHMILKRGHVLVQCIKRCMKCKWKRRFFKPPLDLYHRWYDKEKFAKYALLSYRWSTIDLENLIGLPGNDVITDTNIFWQNDWMSKKCPEWIDRKVWDSEFTNQDQSKQGLWQDWLYHTLGVTDNKKGKWSPFCPPMYNSENVVTLFFFYKFKFYAGGTSFDAGKPGDAENEVLEPPKPGCPGQRCDTCLRHSDLDKWGFIRSRKFRKLVSPHYKDKLAKHSKRKLKRVTWADQIYPKKIKV